MTFWILAPCMVAAALGILFVRKAVHAALLLAFVMISLAVLYASLGAPFLFAVQIIVYTGAILMLFLFVVMLVGVDASDSVVETIRGQRLLSILVGLLVGLVLAIGVGQVSLGAAVGLDAVNDGGNIQALADLLFSRYVFAFEASAALLVTAALGAMVLAHKERFEPKTTQADLAAGRMRDYAESGKHPGPLPAPGVYAPPPGPRGGAAPRPRGAGHPPRSAPAAGRAPPPQRRGHSCSAARRHGVAPVDLAGARCARLHPVCPGGGRRDRARTTPDGS